MLARFTTEDFRGNRVDHVTPIIGAEYAESVMDEKGCQRLTLETDKNYYTTDGITPDEAKGYLDKVFNEENIEINGDFVFEVNAKDSM